MRFPITIIIINNNNNNNNNVIFLKERLVQCLIDSL